MAGFAGFAGFAGVAGYLWVVGCPAPLPSPEIEDIVPGFAFNGDTETVTIVGRRFYPQVEVDAWNEVADVDESFSAWLIGPDGAQNRYSFAGVSIVDDHHLAATLEPGMPKGRYDVEVESPTGLRAKRPDSFVVTDTEAVQLVIESDRNVYDVTETAAVRIKLVDLGGTIVPIDFEVAVTAVPEVGTVSYPSWTLTEGTLTPDGDGVRGLLVAGSGLVSLEASLPSDVTVEVAPWNPDTIVSDTIGLTFQPGDDLHVELRLPVPADPRPEFVAGVPFLVEAELMDPFGNPVQGQYYLDLQTECSGFVANNVEIDGPTLIEVIPEQVTDSLCPDDRVFSTEPAGETPVFGVLPGPVDHFDVGAGPVNLRAGDLVTIGVDPQDAYGNRTSWSGVLTLTDSISSLIEPSCAPWVGVFWACTGRAIRAGIGITAEVEGDDGTMGVSNPFDVIADDVPASAEVLVTGPAAAGVPHPVIVRPYDAYGNPMNTADLGPDAFVLTDISGELSCTFASYEVGGEARFDCLFTTALPDWTLDVSIPAFSIDATSLPFDVTNGPLSVVRFEGESTLFAGEELSLTLFGEDAYGNPYLVQSDPTVTLSDDLQSFSASTATLDSDGSAEVTGAFTRAGSTVLHAEQSGLLLGSSDPIAVLAGPPQALAITPLVPWAFTGEPADIQVETIDDYGNRADWSGLATLSSETTSAPDVVLPLVNGVGFGSFSWSSPSFDEILSGIASSFTGARAVAVVSRCDPAGPDAAVSFGGYSEAIACSDAQGAATITADLSLSSGTSLSGYALAEVNGSTILDSQPIIEMTLDSVGRHDLIALAVDAAGCGDEVAATAWIGPDDGSPTGPLLLSSVSDDISVFDVVDIDVTGALDCTRDAASYASIFVRTTGGTLDATPTGAGLELELDADGNGSLLLETAGNISGDADIEIYASSAGATAIGVLSLPLSGDNLRPIVLSQTPSGQTSELIGEVMLVFSEPLLPSTVIAANFSVSGPTAVTVTTASLSGENVTLTLSPQADGSLGGYTVTATSALRDLAGNKLSGDYSSSASDYHNGFGDAGLIPPTPSCTVTPASLLFRPDGDPGPDTEADEIVFSITSPQAPAWWVLDVYDEFDNLVFLDRQIPLAATDTVSWGGRDLLGMIVSDGIWRVDVSPDDGLGNGGIGCEALVVVDNARGASP